MQLVITGVGAFWVGLFAFLALCVLSEIVTTWIKSHALVKAMKHLANTDDKVVAVLANFLGETLEDGKED